MAAESGVFLFYTFFQLAGVAALAALPREGRSRVFGALVLLLALNAGLSAIESLEAQGFYPEWLDRVAQAMDDPSGYLLLFAVALHAERRGLARTFGALAVVSSAFGLLVPLNTPDEPFATTAAYWGLVALPYYVGLGLFVLRLAGSAAIAERWVALAFLPRGLLFFAQSFLPSPTGAEYLPGLTPPTVSWLTLNTLCNGFVGLACLGGAARLLRRAGSEGPDRGIVVGLALVGPIDAYAWALIPGGSPEARIAGSILNFITLSFIRPLFTYVAFIPGQTWKLLGRAAFAAGLGTALIWVAPALSFPPTAAAFLALSLGSVAIILLRAVAIARPSAPREPAAATTLSVAEVAHLAPPAPPAPEPSKEAPVPTSARPQWEVLLLALHAAEAHLDGPPRAAWTQRGLAEATGINVKRVSEFPEALQAFAAERLDAHVPGWRALPGVGPSPPLVIAQRGHIPGLRGVRVYYRLTPLGASLAEAVRPRVPPPDPGAI